eukprot:4991694-Pyramimonas_sp.AAC.1
MNRREWTHAAVGILQGAAKLRGNEGDAPRASGRCADGVDLLIEDELLDASRLPAKGKISPGELP